MNTIPPEFRSYSLDEVAALMEGGGRRISVRTLQEYCRKGVLRGVKIGAQWRVSHLNLSAWLNGDVPAAGPAPSSSPVEATPKEAPSSEPPRDAVASPATEVPDPGTASRPPEDEKSAAPAIADALPAGEAARTLADLVEEQLAAGPGTEHADLEGAARAPGGETTEAPRVEDSVPAAARAPQAGEPFGDGPTGGASIHEEFHPSGGIKLRCGTRSTKDGRWIRDGLFEAFYESGEAAARGHYVEGRLEGPWEQWHVNGRPKSSGRHAGGLKEGVWTWWDEEGRKTQEGGFRAGRPHGAWTQWHANGQVWCRGAYDNGKPTGQWEWFDGDGRPL